MPPWTIQWFCNYVIFKLRMVQHTLGANMLNHSYFATFQAHKVKLEISKITMVQHTWGDWVRPYVEPLSFCKSCKYAGTWSTKDFPSNNGSIYIRWSSGTYIEPLLLCTTCKHTLSQRNKGSRYIGDWIPQYIETLLLRTSCKHRMLTNIRFPK